MKLVGGAVLAAAGLGVLGHYLGWFGSSERPALKREVRSPQTLDGRSIVSLVKGDDVGEMVRVAIESVGGIEEVVSRNSRVLIKPNVGFNNPEATTSPEVLKAVVEVVREANPREIVIAESAVRGYDTSSNFEKTGISELAKSLNIPLIDLNKTGEVVRVTTRGKLLREVSVFKKAYDADVIISVPRLKRHVQATVTISMKNMMGILPNDQKGMFHILGLHQCIADLNTVFRPDLAIVDATEVMAFSGPGRGEMIPGNAVLASRDPVALDLTAAEYLFELEGDSEPLKTASEVPYIRLAAELGVGTNDPSRIELIERRVD